MDRTETTDVATTSGATGGHAGVDFALRSPWRLVVRVGFAVAMMIGVLVTAFAWPAAESGPNDVPIAVVGPPEAVAEVGQAMSAAMPDAFDVRPAADESAARDLIADRDVYGAIVFDPEGAPTVLTASGGSPAVAQVLRGVADRIEQQVSGPPTVQVEDVVPLPADDPRGAGFNSTALPMVIGGMVVAVGMSFGVAGVWRRVGGALIAAAVAGLVVVLVVQTWLGVLDGDYWVNSGVIALTIGAISLAVIALYSLFGYAGIAIGGLVIFAMGNPLSGVTSAPEMLPSGWGEFGQMLPPGAGGALLRSASFFDGAGADVPLLVLSCWLVGSVLLAALAWLLRERPNAGSTSQAAPAGS